MITAFATMVLVLAVVGTMWERAAVQARRAESAKLYTLAQNEQVPGYAVAYDLAALELSDQPEYRRLAMKQLLQAPLPIRLPALPASHNATCGGFSPDGNWCVICWSLGGGLQLYSTSGDTALIAICLLLCEYPSAEWFSAPLNLMPHSSMRREKDPYPGVWFS